MCFPGRRTQWTKWNAFPLHGNTHHYVFPYLGNISLVICVLLSRKHIARVICVSLPTSPKQQTAIYLGNWSFIFSFRQQQEGCLMIMRVQCELLKFQVSQCHSPISTSPPPPHLFLPVVQLSGVGVGRKKEREGVVTSQELLFRHRKGRCKIMIGQDEIWQWRHYCPKLRSDRPDTFLPFPHSPPKEVNSPSSFSRLAKVTVETRV